MGNVQCTPRWGSIRETFREPLLRFVEHVRTRLGDHLGSITVVGSALTDDFRPGVSDINTVVVLDEHSVSALKAIASLARPMRRHGFSAPLLMTTSYIERSRDVFGIEFLDLQLTHETILGDDPFVGIEIDKPDVRLQCERELKAMLVRLRQGWIAAAGDMRFVRDILVATARGLTPLLRALLWLRDITRPTTMAATVREAADRFRVILDPVLAAEKWRHEKSRPSDADIESTFVGIVGVVDRLATILDEMEV
ncbi:MAG: nucleotidyltransferase domain-containing protein [Phycisphaerae bacterium]|nr:nucleotidyltransferase domain-containing protein [Phycisphaerae bacterium]